MKSKAEQTFEKLAENVDATSGERTLNTVIGGGLGGVLGALGGHVSGVPNASVVRPFKTQKMLLGRMYGGGAIGAGAGALAGYALTPSVTGLQDSMIKRIAQSWEEGSNK